MAGVGIGLDVLGQLRPLAESIKVHGSFYKQAPEQFEKVDSVLARVVRFVDRITLILEEKSDAIPKEILDLFLVTLEDVKESLVRADTASEAFRAYDISGAGSSTGVVRTMANKGRRFF